MKHIKLFEEYNPTQELIDPSVDGYSDGYHSIFETLIKTPGAKGYPVSYVNQKTDSRGYAIGESKRWAISWNSDSGTPVPGSIFSADLDPYNPGKDLNIAQQGKIEIYIAAKAWSRISKKLKSQLGEPAKEGFDVSPVKGFGENGVGWPIIYILDKSTAVTFAKFLEEIKADLIK